MANQFLDAQVYANSMLLLLKNQLVFGKLVNGEYKNQVTDENGLATNVKRPPRFIDKKDGTAALAAQDIVSGSMPVSVDQYSKVHISVGDIEYVESFNSLLQNATMRSAASTLSHSVDRFIGGLTTQFNSWAKGADSAPVISNATDITKGIGSQLQAMAGHTRLMQQGCPNDGNINGVLSFVDGQSIRGSMQSDYAVSLNAPALERVKIPMISEVNWYATQQLPSLTAGTRVQGDGSSSGFQVAGASQNKNYADVKGSAGVRGMTQDLKLDGSTQAGLTVKAGEVFTIAGVYAYDWRAQQKLDYLQQFTVLKDATAAASTGDITLSISPAIIAPVTNDTNKAFATVSAAPADNAYVEFAGAASDVGTVRSVFHKSAISLVSARLQMPFSGTASMAVDPDTGIAIRYWRGSDISTGNHVHRWDMIYGGAVLDANLGTRLAGS